MSMSFDKLVQELAELTDVNAVTESYVLACEWLADKDYSTMAGVRGRMVSIRAEHERLGHMPGYLSQQRYEVYRRMLESAQAILTDAEYERFYAAL